MADTQAIGIVGRVLFNEFIGGTDEAGDDIYLMIGAEGYDLARTALDALESAGYTIEASA